MLSTETKFIQKVNQIGIPATNLERAVSFYQNTLKLPLLFTTNNMAFFDCNGIRLLISLPEKGEFTVSNSPIYFLVENIKDTFEYLTNEGVTFIDKPHIVAKVNGTETWMTFFKDTEGNLNALMSEVQF